MPHFHLNSCSSKGVLCTAWQRPSAPSLTPSHSRRGRRLYLPLNHDTSSLTYFEIRYRYSPQRRVRCLPYPYITKKPAPFQVRVSLCTAWQRPSAPSVTAPNSLRGRRLYLPLNHDTSSLTYFEIRYRHSPPGRVRCLPYPYITKKPAPFQVRVSLCTAWQRPSAPSLTPSHSRRGRHLNPPLIRGRSPLLYFNK